MSYEDLQVNTGTWSTSSSTTSTDKSYSDDLLNELLTTLSNFVNEMSPLFFLNSMHNLQTAIEDFGQGMSAALACVSVDLQVVASGLASAAIAYTATDKAIAETFAHLDTQLAYYTSTTSSVSLATPTAAQLAQLNSLSYSSGSSDSSNLFPNIHIQPPSPSLVAGVTGAGVLLIIGMIILAPVGV